MIVPLLSLSQNQQKDIERKGNKWEISNDAAQAFHYTEVERDSLIKEVYLLRVRIDSLEVEKKRIIDLALKATNKTIEQVDNAIDANDKQTDAQEDITKYWKKLANGFHLEAFISQPDILNFDTKGFQFGIELQTPLSKRIKLKIRPTFQQDVKPIYTLQLNYRIF
jgi:hypothetical protein